jgi:anti-sigma regulatory factor (Ser/Thr protein kinase)
MITRRIFGEDHQSVPEARRFARSALAGMPEDFVDTVALIVSELATNAVLHTSSAFEVAIDFDEERVVIDVSDRGPHTAAPRIARPTDPSGRGLQIVAALADDWGVRGGSSEWSKSVWFVKRLTAPPNAG